MSEIGKAISSLNNDAWINEVIDSVRFIGDVGETDLQFLELILPHCTIDQLMHIEKSFEGRDLTPVMDQLWKTFYERKFGKNDVDIIVKKMHYRNEPSKWMDLYVAKIEELENKAKTIEERILQAYQKEKTRKQSHQIIFCGDEDFSSSNKKPRSKRTIGFECNTTKSSYKRRQILKHKFVRFPLLVIRNVALKEQSDLDTMTIRARY
ncbi:unnamed protein product [Citrullus colocynthis]|uniref:Uncharacterized protein n=1 Tax=Citrullus colocynthis TaxID=252529 RepID=A0ABP0YAU4_9ROSI